MSLVVEKSDADSNCPPTIGNVFLLECFRVLVGVLSHTFCSFATICLYVDLLVFC